MDRKDFLQKISYGAAFALTSTCMLRCIDQQEGKFTPSGSVDFTLDLNDAKYAALKNSGGYIIHNKTVVAKTIDGNYVAATQRCSHEGLYEVIYKDNEWFCTAHDARFTLSGSGLNTQGAGGLTIYKNELNGNILRVFST